MAIQLPVTKTTISTSQWGIPITNQVNANTTDITSIKAQTTTPTTPWADFTLQNGWVNYGSGRANSGYRKLNGLVCVRIGVRSGNMGNPICVLPAGFTPPYYIDWVGRAGPAVAWFNVDVNGQITPFGLAGSDNSFLAAHFQFPIV